MFFLHDFAVCLIIYCFIVPKKKIYILVRGDGGALDACIKLYVTSHRLVIVQFFVVA
jgi:hypothetical protein